MDQSMNSTLLKALDELTQNQLAQVCNNLYCIIRALKVSWCNDTNNELDNIYLELLAKYNTLFKLIYGNE